MRKCGPNLLIDQYQDKIVKIFYDLRILIICPVIPLTSEEQQKQNSRMLNLYLNF